MQGEKLCDGRTIVMYVRHVRQLRIFILLNPSSAPGEYSCPGIYSRSASGDYSSPSEEVTVYFH